MDIIGEIISYIVDEVTSSPIGSLFGVVGVVGVVFAAWTYIKSNDYQQESRNYQRESENYQRESENYQRESENYQRESKELQKRLRTITWDELRMRSQELRKKIESGQSEIPETGQPEIPPFQPDIIFTPCRRGATVANLMYGVDQNILLYVGIRVDNYRGTPSPTEIALPRNTGWEVADTSKYSHYIPSILFEFKDARNLLILDDFAMSGNSLAGVKRRFVEKGFNGEIKTATIVCTDTAKQLRQEPDYYSLDVTDNDFYFPWGKAV